MKNSGLHRNLVNGAAGGQELSLLELVRLLVMKIVSYGWLRKGAAYALLALIVMRLLRRKKSVKGKLVLITGAATGIGREQAFAFAKAGANLALWDINVEALEKTVADVRKASSVTVEGYRINLADREEVYRVADDVRAKQGSPYVLVNNAGIISGNLLMDTPDSRIELSMKVNAMANFWTVKAFLPAMLEKNEGHIIGISSAAGIFPSPRMIDYCTSKFAARGFYEALHTELSFLGKTGVKVSVVCPAHVNTDLFKGYSMGMSMEPSFVASQVLDAVQHPRFHVYLPWALHLGVFWQSVLPKQLWDFFISFSFSAMKGWSPDQANKIFNKIGDK